MTKEFLKKAYIMLGLVLCIQIKLFSNSIIITTNKKAYSMKEIVSITVYLYLSFTPSNPEKIKEPFIKSSGIHIFYKSRFKRIEEKVFSMKLRAKILHNYAYIEFFSYSINGKYGASKKILIK